MTQAKTLGLEVAPILRNSFVHLRPPRGTNAASSASRLHQSERPIAFRSSAYLRVLAQVERFGRAGRAPILIEGESGTGKTQLARQLHRSSPRAGSPFEYVILSAVDDNLAGSELFGHVTGAFTDARINRAGHFATAAGGTLFLDEIGKASRLVQQRLLHAVEYGEIRPIGSDRDVRVDVRIIAASNVPLAELASDERFLPDLYARLSAFRISLPSLRERRADIPLLAEHYVHLHAPDAGYAQQPSIHPDLMAALQRARWPNNLRQLDSTIFRILVDADGAPQLRREHCLDDLRYLNGSDDERVDEPLSSQAAEEAIARAGGSVSGAARLLGVDRTTIHRARKRSALIAVSSSSMLHDEARNVEKTVAQQVDEEPPLTA